MTVLLSGIVLVGAFAFVAACCAGLVLAMYRVSARALPADGAGTQATQTEATRMEATRMEATRTEATRTEATRTEATWPQVNRPEASSARPAGH
jgi:hypothetical protein